jgi:hypothetical protein
MHDSILKSITTSQNKSITSFQKLDLLVSFRQEREGAEVASPAARTENFDDLPAKQRKKPTISSAFFYGRLTLESRNSAP